MISVAAYGLICNMKHLSLVKEQLYRSIVSVKHSEPIMTGCYNNHRCVNNKLNLLYFNIAAKQY
jgi:hypothetical protein